ncbi:MAG: DUF503 domain-containing protein [Candidatus Omnitrophica bacterium]|nr:DUF503 domain-containing protein [Candidatus Omnitrophota bacterium]MCM8798599.1 DUF503 domain-containing protein [Candidatus Omnitrophota bacterium]
MSVGILEVVARIEGSHSLKDKRMVLKSLKDRLRNKFNIAISEVGNQDKWQSTQLCIVTVNSDKRYVNCLLSKVVEFMQKFSGIELIDYHMEFI